MLERRGIFSPRLHKGSMTPGKPRIVATLIPSVSTLLNLIARLAFDSVPELQRKTLSSGQLQSCSINFARYRSKTSPGPTIVRPEHDRCRNFRIACPRFAAPCRQHSQYTLCLPHRKVSTLSTNNCTAYTVKRYGILVFDCLIVTKSIICPSNEV